MQENQEEYWGMPVNTYCMLLHLSQLASILAPGLGVILPIVMWVVHKDKNEQIDQHGKVTINWLLSAFIYSIICGILMVVLIGILGFLVLFLLNFIFAIIAAIKANEGQLWAYPISFKFLKY